MKTRNSRSKRHQRQGAAVVEFAVCLPIIVLIVLGSIQAASMLFLRQALIQSAYEGAKIAIRNDGTNLAAETAIQNVATGRRIQGLTFAFSSTAVPSGGPDINVEDVNAGNIIFVTVSAPADNNSFIPFGLFQGRVISAQAAMAKE